MLWLFLYALFYSALTSQGETEREWMNEWTLWGPGERLLSTGRPLGVCVSLVIECLQWHPTPVFLPGTSHGQKNLAGYRPWGRKELDMTEHTHIIGFAEELKNSYMCIPWGKTWILSGGCTIVSSLLLPVLCIPSLPWLATIWTCPLELRRGQGGWSLFPTNRKWETEKLPCPGAT